MCRLDPWLVSMCHCIAHMSVPHMENAWLPFVWKTQRVKENAKLIDV